MVHKSKFSIKGNPPKARSIFEKKNDESQKVDRESLINLANDIYCSVSESGANGDIVEVLLSISREIYRNCNVDSLKEMDNVHFNNRECTDVCDKYDNEQRIIAPCPFCGGEAKIYSALVGTFPYFVVCQECGATSSPCDTPYEVIEAWNKRYQTPKDDESK